MTLSDSSETERAAVTLAASGDSTLASPTFFGFVTTQFLGAFNDNYYKQMVLLSCAAAAAAGGTDRQPVALAAFALPFVLLSGFAGFLSDRFSKTRIIVLCKVAEIAVMGCSLVVLLLPGVNDSLRLWLLISVLGLMGSQSAFFGPSKYGSLPELFRPDKLLPVNGIIQMTTFMAIIFGMVAAGIALDQLNQDLWLGSMVAVGIAAAGTLTSLLIRPVRAAMPELRLRWDNLAIPKQTRTLLLRNRKLLGAVLASMVFWFIGGVTQPAVNTLGKLILQLSDTRTSVMASGLGVGIALGCVAAGMVPNRRGNTCIVVGCLGIIGSFLLIALLASRSLGVPKAAGAAAEPIMTSLFHADATEWLLRFSMTFLGFFSGVFVVPVQVFLQRSPPAAEKGRLLGALNLVTWIGIVLSALFLLVADAALKLSFGRKYLDWYFLVFAAMALLMVPIAARFRLELDDLDRAV
jgi:MFS family permease